MKEDKVLSEREYFNYLKKNLQTKFFWKYSEKQIYPKLKKKILKQNLQTPSSTTRNGAMYPL